MTLDEILDDILAAEGGYTADPADAAHQLRRRNGDQWDSFATNMGITQATLSDWMGRQATAEEVRHLSRESARAIYTDRYYYTPRINWLLREIQPVTTDMAVHHGPRRAIKLLQRVVNQLGDDPINVDGVIGSQTCGAVVSIKQAVGSNHLINALCDARDALFHRLVRIRPANQRFLRGWLARSDKFRQQGAAPH